MIDDRHVLATFEIALLPDGVRRSSALWEEPVMKDLVGLLQGPPQLVLMCLLDLLNFLPFLFSLIEDNGFPHGIREVLELKFLLVWVLSYLGGVEKFH